VPNWFSGDQVSVWIDLNQDGLLSDATEQFPLLSGGTSGTDPFTGSISIPVTATTGATRMRVRCNYSGAMSSCGITTYGEVEDYTVIIDPVITNTTLNLTCFIQGYYDSVAGIMKPVLFNQGEPTTTGACDSIDVLLHGTAAPYPVLYSVRTVLQQNGNATCVFPSLNGNYYIAIMHRNAVQTWSADSVAFTTPTVTYNFTNAQTQAYGGNQIEVAPGVWALYTGDIIVDENVDLVDLGELETGINNFDFGFKPADLNGDGNVDLVDSPILEANISNFIFSNHP
jgi:hypothetical protein